MHPMLRVAIPLLRLPTWYVALYAFNGLPDTRYVPPFQKVFYRPIFLALWGILAILPFILIRRRRAYIFYCGVFAIIAGWILFDEFFPFRYVAPDFTGEARDGGGSYNIASSGTHYSYYFTHFVPSSPESWFMPALVVWPLLLGTLYHYAYTRKHRNA